MIKSQELSDPQSCMSRARPDEMVFVLLGRDAAAPAAIYRWCEERVRLGRNQRGDAQIVEALECAMSIERELAAAASVKVKITKVVEVALTEQDKAERVLRMDVTVNPRVPHPTAPGWMWNTLTNEVVSDAQHAAL